jgi:hypothetical protein
LGVMAVFSLVVGLAMRAAKLAWRNEMTSDLFSTASQLWSRAGLE